MLPLPPLSSPLLPSPPLPISSPLLPSPPLPSSPLPPLLSSPPSFWCASCKVQLEEDETNFCYYLTLQVTDGDSVAMVTIFGPSLDAVFAMPARLCHA